METLKSYLNKNLNISKCMFYKKNVGISLAYMEFMCIIINIFSIEITFDLMNDF